MVRVLLATSPPHPPLRVVQNDAGAGCVRGVAIRPLPEHAPLAADKAVSARAAVAGAGVQQAQVLDFGICRGHVYGCRGSVHVRILHNIVYCRLLGCLVYVD